MTDVVFCTRPRISRMKGQAKPSWMMCHRLFCLFHYLLWVVSQTVNLFLLVFGVDFCWRLIDSRFTSGLLSFCITTNEKRYWR